MKPKYAFILAASLAVAPVFAAKKKEDVVEMSGISIIGNRELPKTLFIVPWKNSEVGVETELTNTLNEGMQPLDAEVFRRELDYYDSSKPQ
ncbi:MAG TPA: hypothetical protein VFX02_07340 [Gammaproteobacteria bacterium]|nr:hypothetical protein [Gammaproteobacteria bacterium]